jgi:hypothetical protein
MQNWVKRVHLKEKELLEVEIERSVKTIAANYLFLNMNDRPAINFLWVCAEMPGVGQFR